MADRSEKDNAEGAGHDQQQDQEEDVKQDLGVPPQDLLEEINQRGEQAVLDWHDQILKYPPKVDAFLEAANTSKNRFPNVLLYDRSRVRIRDKLGSDYYHASFVDSYDKADGYILAQAPFDDGTETDFWRMCYQQRPSLIVLLTALVTPNGKRLAKNFWPSTKQEREYASGNVRIRCGTMDQERDFDTYEITMMGQGQRQRGGIRTQLMQFRKWTDDRQIPDNLLEFRAILKIAMARAEKDGRAEGPVMFVCPSGVHRCGTVAALDIVIDRMTAERKVGLLETIAIVRRQRYGCFTHFEHYAHVADLVVRHAVSSGIVDPTCIGVRKR